MTVALEQHSISDGHPTALYGAHGIHAWRVLDSAESPQDRQGQSLAIENSIHGGMVPHRPSTGALVALPGVVQAVAIALYGSISTLLSPYILPQYTIWHGPLGSEEVSRIFTPFCFQPSVFIGEYQKLSLCAGALLLVGLTIVLALLHLLEALHVRGLATARRAILAGMATTAIITAAAWVFEGTLLPPTVVLTASLVILLSTVIQARRDDVIVSRLRLSPATLQYPEHRE